MLFLNSLNKRDGIVTCIKTAVKHQLLVLSGVATCLSLTFNRARQAYGVISVYLSPRTNLTHFIQALNVFYLNGSCKTKFQVLTGYELC